MSIFDYRSDLWVWPFELDGSNNQLRIEEDPDSSDGGPYTATITLTKGWYYNLDKPASTLPVDQDGLLKAIADALSGLQYNYSIQAQTTRSGGPQNMGLALVNDDGEDFNLKFGHGDWTLDPRYLGFHENLSSTISSTSSTVDSPFSLWGQWRSWSLLDGKATTKEHNQTRRTERTTDDAARGRAQTHWERRERQFKYEAVPGALVQASRADDEPSADRADLAYGSANFANAGDTHNHIEALWDHLARPAGPEDKLARGLVYHDQGEVSHSPTNRYREEVRLVEGMRDFREMGDLAKTEGEFYEIDFRVSVVQGRYDDLDRVARILTTTPTIEAAAEVTTTPRLVKTVTSTIETTTELTTSAVVATIKKAAGFAQANAEVDSTPGRVREGYGFSQATAEVDSTPGKVNEITASATASADVFSNPERVREVSGLFSDGDGEVNSNPERVREVTASSTGDGEVSSSPFAIEGAYFLASGHGEVSNFSVA